MEAEGVRGSSYETGGAGGSALEEECEGSSPEADTRRPARSLRAQNELDQQRVFVNGGTERITKREWLEGKKAEWEQSLQRRKSMQELRDDKPCLTEEQLELEAKRLCPFRARLPAVGCS